MRALRRNLYFTTEVCLLLAGIAATVLTSRDQDWHPLPLVVLLLALTLVGQQMTVRVRNQDLSASFLALVLAMTLLGPTPAAVFGVAAAVSCGVRLRVSRGAWLNNVATFVVFPVCGGLLVRLLLGNVHAASDRHLIQSVSFGLLVFGIFMVTNTMNFALIAVDKQLREGDNVLKLTRQLFVPLLPGQVATGALAAVLAVAYTNLGYPALLGLVLVLLIFQYLAIALLRSEDRADQLEARSIRLASLQLGVLTTLVETLALRDRAAARHAAAVARSARDLAREAGCDEADQDLAHSAGLLHDIGKFALPDRLLHAIDLSPADEAIIRRHPQEGSTLVGRLDGYGPVADAILYHHERVDGTGYPAGLIGNEIPLPSRILAVCNAYDKLTATDWARVPMEPAAALVELNKAAGSALDADLVGHFVAMVSREDPESRADGAEANFEEELAFERRARSLAQVITA